MEQNNSVVWLPFKKVHPLSTTKICGLEEDVSDGPAERQLTCANITVIFLNHVKYWTAMAVAGLFTSIKKNDTCNWPKIRPFCICWWTSHGFSKPNTAVELFEIQVESSCCACEWTDCSHTNEKKKNTAFNLVWKLRDENIVSFFVVSLLSHVLYGKHTKKNHSRKG